MSAIEIVVPLLLLATIEAVLIVSQIIMWAWLFRGEEARVAFLDAQRDERIRD